MMFRALASISLVLLLALNAGVVAAAARGIDPPLIEAVKARDAASARSLLEAGAAADTGGPDGTTALAWAVRGDDTEMADLLLEAGADPAARNRYGITPLYLAAVNGSAAMIERLLEAGADANETGNEGETVLMTAARSGSLPAIRVLLSRGAEVDRREGWHGQTALMWAVAQGHPDVAAELVARGADVNARSDIDEWERQSTAEPRQKWLPPGGLTPMIFAAREGCAGCVPVLAGAGADLDAADPDGITPLISALINGHYDTAEALLEAGADPNLADSTGRTALYAAVDFNTMPDSNRPAPYVLGEETSSFELIQGLIARGADVNAQLQRQAPYRAKLDRGNDTMLTTGTTPLLRAAKAADVPAVRLLLENGADPSLTTRAGIDPLMAAAGLGTAEQDTTGRRKSEQQMIETIELLLDAGLDVNAANGRGQTAAHGAALQGYDQVIQFLYDRGADLGAADRNGLTPLDTAMGLAGGFGFDGQAGVVHESTAELIRKLTGEAAPQEP